jgi:hypothetical protein
MVFGEIDLNVSDPVSFAQDRNALDAVAQTIAEMSSVPRYLVHVKLSFTAAPSPLDRRLSTAPTAADPSLRVVVQPVESNTRRASVALKFAGRVNADFSIFVPAGVTPAGLAEDLKETDTGMATDTLLKVIGRRHMAQSYLVEVRRIQADFMFDLREAHASRATKRVPAFLAIAASLALMISSVAIPCVS